MKIHDSKLHNNGQPFPGCFGRMVNLFDLTSGVNGNRLLTDRWTEDVNEKKMALIRQKFMEAKRLSTDERLLQSKEFKDALEVLSSNKDLFLRFLDSQNPYELQSPRSLPSGNFHPKDDDDVPESRKVAKVISSQVHENMSSHHRDEALHSFVCSNGHTGDDSSFNRSENDYAAGNFSELEVMSPSSRHSWEYVNRHNGPYSPSSFSRASYSPESSVSREAKKRLSERWTMISSSKRSQEQRHMRRSSSLGEMLALSDEKKSVSPEVESRNKEQKPRESSSNTNEEIQVHDSPKTLSRSKFDTSLEKSKPLLTYARCKKT